MSPTTQRAHERKEGSTDGQDKKIERRWKKTGARRRKKVAAGTRVDKMGRRWKMTKKKERGTTTG